MRFSLSTPECVPADWELRGFIDVPVGSDSELK